ncbi:ceramide synthase 2-like [Hippoglossus hippoglossus]|uniref:ceramide synthase 2-like n=1 Tax=Hippoglossus hippoglossus TaxID=8267 RepID=UPI00148C7478|nr:ceramide synthase 2-like [Hippoglossus hippoglossus]XP_034469795.1 ceramide synthase 2-like [Hippoglossus hippoglossus]XP_034469796.1 ceramide synthase 2-like [Hippoglossus hippoglossus]XP_034469797.1 ceramide synthase 2-like [Hippoglossus hippoglossus]
MDLLPDLWRQEYWLPPGVTWEDMEQLADCDRPRPLDILLGLPLALGFVALRYPFERFVAPPMGRCLGVKNRSQVTAAPSPRLESFYTQRSREPTQSEIVGLMKLCGKTQRQIETWFHRRRNQDRPSQTKKFGEAAWRFFFYFISFTAAFTSLIHKPWLWDLRECWRQYPLQPMERAHYWYYMMELGFYGSLLLRISVDVKRKDFKEQVMHHLATIFLLTFSYCANYIRIGTLVIALHDLSDILLESAKMFNYGTGWRRTCDALFVVFAVVFLVTRLVIFPSKLIHTTLVLSMETFQPFVGYYFFNILLMVLQVLHIFWAGLILRMVYKFLKGKMDKDERSDDESEVEEEEEEEEDKGGEDTADQGGDYCWERSKGALNSKLSMLTNSCVLNNLTNHRASAVDRMRKAQ